MISFLTSGLIDPRAITTLGVSVKETENPIGFFGTGLKYAIAIILRNGGSITIWSGLDRYDFTAKTVSIRGQDIQLVCMNGQELGFTTQLGKQWEMWKAFREIYCNTMDEGGEVIDGVHPPAAGNSVVHVTQPEFEQAYIERHKYFLTTQPIAKGVHANFHQGPENGIFYRGIRVMDTAGTRPMLFRTNITSKIDLTEDRTVKSQWDLWFHIGRSVLLSPDKAFIERWLTAGKDYQEHQISVDWAHETPSPEFLEVAAMLMRDTSRPLNTSAIAVLARHAKVAAPKTIQLLAHEQRRVDAAVSFCKRLGYEVDEYPILFVESLGNNVLGSADISSRTVMISRQAIDSGDAMLAGTLLEEWVHLKHGYSDCERDMQNWLFNQVIRLGVAYVGDIR